MPGKQANKIQREKCGTLAPRSHLSWGEGRVENKSDDIQRSIYNLISFRQAIHATVVELHEHVVVSLQGMCISMGFGSTALYNNISVERAGKSQSGLRSRHIGSNACCITEYTD